MADYISRQAALNALCDNCDTVDAVCPHFPCKRYTSIEALPSVQPQSTMGQVNDTAQSTNDCISRQAIDEIIIDCSEINGKCAASVKVFINGVERHDVRSIYSWKPLENFGEGRWDGLKFTLKIPCDKYTITEGSLIFKPRPLTELTIGEA